VKNALSQLCADQDTVKLITELCTYNYQIPQGFPTSPTIAETVLTPLARRIWGICKRYDFKLSIYIDDIIISGGPKLCDQENRIRGLFADMRFLLNKKKSGLFTSAQGCDITGVHLRNGTATTTRSFDAKLQLFESLVAASTGTLFDDELLEQKIHGLRAWPKQISKRLQYHRVRCGARC